MQLWKFMEQFGRFYWICIEKKAEFMNGSLEEKIGGRWKDLSAKCQLYGQFQSPFHSVLSCLVKRRMFQSEQLSRGTIIIFGEFYVACNCKIFLQPQRTEVYRRVSITWEAHAFCLSKNTWYLKEKWKHRSDSIKCIHQEHDVVTDIWESWLLERHEDVWGILPFLTLIFKFPSCRYGGLSWSPTKVPNKMEGKGIWTSSPIYKFHHQEMTLYFESLSHSNIWVLRND